jgi:hypothetical protein
MRKGTERKGECLFVPERPSLLSPLCTGGVRAYLTACCLRVACVLLACLTLCVYFCAWGKKQSHFENPWAKIYFGSTFGNSGMSSNILFTILPHSRLRHFPLLQSLLPCRYIFICTQAFFMPSEGKLLAQISFWASACT